MSNKLRNMLMVLALFLAIPSNVFALKIELNPAFEFPYTYQGQQVIAVGRDGLFLDSDTSAPAAWQGNPSMQVAFADWHKPANNFTWLNVTMDIDETTGNAVIAGTMKNNANANDLYSLTMNLTGMCVRNGNSCTAKPVNFDLRAFLENPANGNNSALGTDLDTGFEWANVSLHVEALPGGPNPLYTGVTDFVGWSMAPLHDNPIELHVWSNSPGPGDLYLQAWYQAFNGAGQRIGTGDTKAFGVLLDDPTPPPPPNPVPEPSSLLLLGTAGLGLLRRKAKK